MTGQGALPDGWSETRSGDAWELALQGVRVAWIRSDGRLYLDRAFSVEDMKIVRTWAASHD